jgi:hypothetical protein
MREYPLSALGRSAEESERSLAQGESPTIGVAKPTIEGERAMETVKLGWQQWEYKILPAVEHPDAVLELVGKDRWDLAAIDRKNNELWLYLKRPI